MRKLTIIAGVCAALAAAAPGGTQAAPAGGGYDILGLKLGMTAAQAEAVITQRLHIHPDSKSNVYNVSSGPGHYVPGRSYVGALSVHMGQSELILNFTEVPRGAGPGSEELYIIQYTPVTEGTTSDKAAFVAQVHKKFGPPVKVFDQQDEFWANRAYDNPLAFSQANTPVLQLTVYSAKLELSNNGISYRMERIFNSQRTTKPQL